MNTKKYTNENIQQDIIKKYKELGRIPTKSDISHQFYSLCCKRFGSYKEALNSVGLEHIKKPYKKYTNEELAKNMLDLYEKLGHIPTSKDFDNYSTINWRVYYNRFGNWNNALIEAGFDSNKLKSNKKYSKEELIKILQETYLKLNRVPKSYEMTNPSYFSYYLKFKSWNNALIEAGLIKDKEKS